MWQDRSVLTSEKAHVPRILIVGGGYRGLRVALGLQRKLRAPAEIMLISKHDYHYQTTLLHKVAGGTLSSRKARVFFRKLLDPRKVTFVKDRIVELRPEENVVVGNGGEYAYDYLVVAMGFRPNTYGVPGADQHAFKLSSLNASLDLVTNIENRFKEYVHTRNAEDLSVVVCGTGLTGVEFAAELAAQIDELCQIGGIDRSLPKITCVGRSEQRLRCHRAFAVAEQAG